MVGAASSLAELLECRGPDMGKVGLVVLRCHVWMRRRLSMLINEKALLLAVGDSETRPGSMALGGNRCDGQCRVTGEGRQAALVGQWQGR